MCFHGVHKYFLCQLKAYACLQVEESFKEVKKKIWEMEDKEKCNTFKENNPKEAHLEEARERMDELLVAIAHLKSQMIDCPL